MCSDAGQLQNGEPEILEGLGAVEIDALWPAMRVDAHGALSGRFREDLPHGLAQDLGVHPCHCLGRVPEPIADELQWHAVVVDQLDGLRMAKGVGLEAEDVPV